MNPHLHALIREHLQRRIPITIEPESSLRNDLGASDLDMMCLVIACEEAFGIDIRDAEISGLETVADLERLVAGKSAKAA